SFGPRFSCSSRSVGCWPPSCSPRSRPAPRPGRRRRSRFGRNERRHLVPGVEPVVVMDALLEARDVVVIGGGAAGLNGALMLARSRRSVLVVDAGTPRNAPADGVH